MVNHNPLFIVVLALSSVLIPSLQAGDKTTERKAQTPPLTSRPSSVDQHEFASFRRRSSVARAASMPVGSLPFDSSRSVSSVSSRRASGTPRTPDRFSQLKSTSFGARLAKNLITLKVASLPEQFTVDYLTLSLVARLNPKDKDTLQRSFLKLFATKVEDINIALANTLEEQNLTTLASGSLPANSDDEFSGLMTFLSPIRQRIGSTESPSPSSTPELQPRRLTSSPSLGAQDATSPVPALHLPSAHSFYSSTPFRRAASTESSLASSTLDSQTSKLGSPNLSAQKAKQQVPPLQLSSILSPHSSPPLTGRRGQADLPHLAISSPPSASSKSSPGSSASPLS